MIKPLTTFFLGTRRRALFTGLFLFCALTVLDYILAEEVSIDIFYFAPIAIVTWYGNRAWGIGLSLVGTLAWLADALIITPAAFATPQIFFWNATVRLFFFLTLIYILAKLNGLLIRERAASRLKSTMIRMVSHEFNNSLTAISGGLFLLEETEPGGSNETRSELYTMLNNARHKLAGYVKNILNEARLEDGKFKLEKTTFALSDLALKTAGDMRGLLKQKNIELSMRMPGTAVLLHADQTALALIASNLLANAIKYTPQNGKITIKISLSEEPPDKVIFSVEDTGIGISLDDLNKITTGFYRTEGGKTLAEGFGMGLTIINQLLNLHGSQLEISSEPGKGSNFFFKLPVHHPEKQ